MSGSLAEDMDIKIQGRFKTVLITLFVFPLILILTDDIREVLQTIGKGQDFNNALVGLTEHSVFITIDIFAALLAAMSRNFLIHRKIDRFTFNALGRVKERIKSDLVEAANKIDIPRDQINRMLDGDFMRLFYAFANKQDELRKHAFYYWQNYFVQLTLMFFSGVCGILCFYAVIFTPTFKHSWIIAFLPFIYTAAAIYEARFSLFKKMLDHASEQIRAAQIETPHELKKQISERFS